MRYKARIGGLVVLVIAPSIAQAEVAIHGSAHHVRIAVVLPVILPPANLAQLEGLGKRQGFVPAAQAAGGCRSSHEPSMRPVCSRWEDSLGTSYDQGNEGQYFTGDREGILR